MIPLWQKDRAGYFINRPSLESVVWQSSSCDDINDCVVSTCWYVAAFLWCDFLTLSTTNLVVLSLMLSVMVSLQVVRCITQLYWQSKNVVILLVLSCLIIKPYLISCIRSIIIGIYQLNDHFKRSLLLIVQVARQCTYLIAGTLRTDSIGQVFRVLC